MPANKYRKFNTCPDCGQQKDERSQRCDACNRLLRHLPVVCPRCGGHKDNRAKFCPDCKREMLLQKSYDHLDPLWCSTFAGLFMGEGSGSIYFDDRYGQGAYHASLTLHMRADERALFTDLHVHLGGHIYQEKAKGNSSPQLQWVTHDTASVYGICQLLLRYTIIPAKKLRDVQVIAEFCEWRASVPFHVDDWSPAKELRNRLLSYRAYSEDG